MWLTAVTWIVVYSLNYFVSATHWNVIAGFMVTNRGVSCPTVSYEEANIDFCADQSVILETFIRGNAATLRRVYLCSNEVVIKAWVKLLARSSCSLTEFSTSNWRSVVVLDQADKVAIRTILTNSAHRLFKLSMVGLKDLQAVLGSNTFPLLSEVALTLSRNDDLLRLCQASPNLQKIKLDHYCGTIRGLTAVGRYCHELEDLTLYNPKSSNMADFMEDIEEAAVAMGGGCPKLKRLSLEYCRNWNDDDLLTLFTYCTQLAELNIAGNDDISDDSLIALAHSGSGRLRSVTLAECSAIHGTGIAAIAARCPLLDTVSLHGMDSLDDSIKNAIPRLKNVKNLQFPCSLCVDDAMLGLIAEHMPLLEKLDIIGFMSGVDAIDKLMRIELGETREVSDEQVEQWQQLRPGLVILESG